MRSVDSLFAACRNDDVESVLELLRSDPVYYLEQSNNEGQNLIHMAFERGNLVMCTAILELEDQENSRKVLDYVIRLHPGRDDLLVLLLQAGQDFLAVINDQGQTALHLAAECGNLDVCRRLLERLPKDQVNRQSIGEENFTASCAIFGHQPEMCADYGATFVGSDALLLHRAAKVGDCQAMQLLLSYGVGIDYKSFDSNETALSVAMRSNQTSAFIFLLQHGANPIVENDVDADTSSASAESTLFLRGTLAYLQEAGNLNYPNISDDKSSVNIKDMLNISEYADDCINDLKHLIATDYWEFTSG